ncbi:hypothetical protein GGS20DRAFT_589244 [Poronia punctata]|nr:hypothetical protein GGS20DRAFT_589244 [Poronia punctata]
MVSFFGLKIGGEKKKSPKGLQISAPQPQNTDFTSPGNQLDIENGINAPFESIPPLTRRNSAKSTMSRKGKLMGLKLPPFASNKFSSSLVDLPKPPGLKHHASNPSIGRRWKGDSSSSVGLAPPSGFHLLARPSTSDDRSKKWASPLDIRLSRNSSKQSLDKPTTPSFPDQDGIHLGTPTSATTTTPKSPLGQYELKLDLPSDVSTFADFGNFTEIVQAPAPLRIKKQPSTRGLNETQTEERSDRKPPTPPQSIDDRDAALGTVPDLSNVSTDKAREESEDSIPQGLEELQNAISNFGPTSLPSPSTTPRGSEDKTPATTSPPRPVSPPPPSSKPRPVIQNVRAKRDTLTVNPQRRRSLQMKIEAAEAGTLPPLSQISRPKTSNGGRSLPRPPALNLNTSLGISAADRDGPRSAPFPPNPSRSFTPTGLKAPVRSHTVVQGRSNPSAQVDEFKEVDSTPPSPAGSSVYDDVDYPPSPESPGPLIPLTGPLASPRFPPSSHFSASDSASSIFPWKEERRSNRSLSPSVPLVPPRSTKRNAPTPDSSYWPLPSPIVPAADRATASPSPAESRLRSESESSSAYEPLAPPRIPSARSGAESPTMRSFSRPWTPTVGINEFTSPLKRAETAGPLAGPSAEGEIVGGLRPPPRSSTVKTPKTASVASRYPSSRAAAGDSGGGFI